MVLHIGMINTARFQYEKLGLTTLELSIREVEWYESRETKRNESADGYAWQLERGQAYQQNDRVPYRHTNQSSKEILR